MGMPDDTEMHSNPDCQNAIDVAHYRKLVKQFIEMRRFQTALFWAEKIAVLSQNDPRDVYCQAQCLFLLKEYHRAAHTIRLHELEKSHIPCYNLLLESLYEAKEYVQAVSIINTVDIEFLASSLINQPLDGGCSSIGNQSMFGCEETNKREVLASISYLKGKIFEAMDNRGMAMDFYVQALHKSVYCYEALEALVQHEMLMAWEEKELMQHLPFEQQSSVADAKFITKLYETKLKKYYDTVEQQRDVNETPIENINAIKEIKVQTDKVNKHRKSDLLKKCLSIDQSNIQSPANKMLEEVKQTSFLLHVSLSRASSLIHDSTTNRSRLDSTGMERTKEPESQFVLELDVCFERLVRSTDLMAAEAEKLFYDGEYKKSSKLLDELLKIDPFHTTALTVHIGCLVEFGDFNKLFYVAHKLVDRYPEKAISWYAVGCYYDLVGKSDPARRYFTKATSLDRLYGPSWLAYGHSFAKENEHDQAMAAYFKATQLMRGCHLPLLYIGVECGLTKNLELAEKFFYQAMSIAPLDVFVLHELGVIKYEYEYYDSAEEVFRTTVDIVTKRAKQNNEGISPRWEPLFNNLGHCCRKTKKYKEALEFHQFALLLKPQTPHIYTAIGFVHSLMGNLDEAITCFHKSLALNRDCIVTSTILKTCIDDAMEQERTLDILFSKNIMSSSAILKSRYGGKEDSAATSYNCVKLKFDDTNVSANTSSNPSMVMDISMDESKIETSMGLMKRRNI